MLSQALPTCIISFSLHRCPRRSMPFSAFPFHRWQTKLRLLPVHQLPPSTPYSREALLHPQNHQVVFPSHDLCASCSFYLDDDRSLITSWHFTLSFSLPESSLLGRLSLTIFPKDHSPPRSWPPLHSHWICQIFHCICHYLTYIIHSFTPSWSVFLPKI